jgi:hypothetical protein
MERRDHSGKELGKDEYSMNKHPSRYYKFSTKGLEQMIDS